MQTLIAVLASVASLGLCASDGSVVEESLSDFRPSKFTSWLPKRDVPVKTLYGCRLELTQARKAVSQTLCGYFFPAFTASEKVRVSFRYRGTARAFSFVLDLSGPNEKPLPGQIKVPYLQKDLPLKDGWQDFSIDIDWPRLDYWGFHILRVLAQGDGTESFVELSGVDIRELAPERPVGRPLLIGGARAAEVAVLDVGDALRHEEDLRAARMFRYSLYVNGGDYLPVRTAKSLDEIGAAAVLVGTAAEKAGLFTPDDLRTAFKPTSGACVFRVKGTRLGLAGDLPVGPAYGVFAFWRELGVEYLGNMKWRCPKVGAFAAPDGFGRAIVPGVAYRCDNARNELGLMPELRGRCAARRTFCHYSEGCRTQDIGIDHNMPGGLVTLDEFAVTRPDFFAMRKDGSRMTDVKPWLVQYCLSNKDLKELTANRVLEMMRLHPEATLFPISPGDGGGNNCQCETCRARPQTDVWLEFVNFIAERTSREFPHKYVAMAIYVYNKEPSKTVKPHPNVSANYCIYVGWPSCMRVRDPANAGGWREIAAWRKVFPRLRLTHYPSECGENFNIWPSFDSDNDLIADFARNRAMNTKYFGYAVARAGSMPQTPGFCDLRLYVAARVEEDPGYDTIAGAHGFIRDFYGAAAPEMTAYFEFFRTEAERRRWVQNSEQHLKGFITKEFAAKCLPLLDAAEAKLKDDPVNLPAVLHEKQNFLWTYLDGWNRGMGNVSKAEFPEWARRVAEFCRICRDTNIGYLSYVGFPKWFHDACFVEFELGHGDKFFDHPAVKAIIENPEKGLGGDYPTLQKQVPGGCEIPAKGFAGGQFSVSSWCRRKKAEERTLRRPSSGFGLAQTWLNLKAKPTKDVKMFLCGIDNDHPSVAEMEVVVNEKTIYSGKVPWKKDAWSEAPFVIPAKLLTEGDNEIKILNTTGDGDEKDGDCGEMFRAKHNYYWGWFSIEKLRFEVEWGK